MSGKLSRKINSYKTLINALMRMPDKTLLHINNNTYTVPEMITGLKENRAFAREFYQHIINKALLEVADTAEVAEPIQFSLYQYTQAYAGLKITTEKDPFTLRICSYKVKDLLTEIEYTFETKSELQSKVFELRTKNQKILKNLFIKKEFKNGLF